jgi:uncharacterized protein YigE (DUF2233 family)
MDIFDLARQSKNFSEYLDAWMLQADDSLYAWLDGYLSALLDAQIISADQRLALITMLSMSASRGASSRQ